MSHEKESDGVVWAAAGVLVLLLIYFGLPGLWIWPFWKIYGWALPEWLGLFMQPIGGLIETFPAYERFVGWQAELVGMKK